MYVKRHKLESELIKSAAEGLGFSYSEPVRAKSREKKLFKITIRSASYL